MDILEPTIALIGDDLPYLPYIARRVHAIFEYRHMCFFEYIQHVYILSLDGLILSWAHDAPLFLGLAPWLKCKALGTLKISLISKCQKILAVQGNKRYQLLEKDFYPESFHIIFNNSFFEARIQFSRRKYSIFVNINHSSRNPMPSLFKYRDGSQTSLKEIKWLKWSERLHAAFALKPMKLFNLAGLNCSLNLHLPSSAHCFIHLKIFKQKWQNICAENDCCHMSQIQFSV